MFTCPVCASLSVDLAGHTDLYQSIVCRDCQAWSTVPASCARPRARTARPDRNAARPRLQVDLSLKSQ